MNYSVASIFPTPLIQVEVEEDTSELLGHNQYTVSDEQRFDYEKPSASRRVLEEYPLHKQMNIIIEIFLYITEITIIIIFFFIFLINSRKSYNLSKY